MAKSIPANSLVGEVLTHIDIDESSDRILLTTQSGRQILIHHEQDCCESVSIEDTEGNWHSLLGKPLAEVSEEYGQIGNPPEYADSWTRTELTFKVDGATVINRWIGESNGYYSETIDLVDITAKEPQ